MSYQLKKYINKNIKSFCEVRELLDKDGVETISFFGNHKKYGINRHSEILIEFLNLDNEKNDILNLDALFFNAKIEYNYYTQFPLLKFFDKLENDSRNHTEWKQIKFILPYIKELKYCQEILAPLKDLITDSYNHNIHLNTRDNKMKLIVYKYENKQHQELEIIEATQWSKNPIYGLLHYIQLDDIWFRSKSLVFQEQITYNVDSKNFEEIHDFLKSIELKNFKYKLEADEESSQMNLSFFDLTEKINTKSLLTFDNFDIEFLISVFEHFYYFESFITKLKQLKINLYFSYTQEKVDGYINEKYIEVESDSELLKNILISIVECTEMSLLKRFKFFLKGTNFIDELITKDIYADYRKRPYINYELERSTK